MPQDILKPRSGKIVLRPHHHQVEVAKFAEGLGIRPEMFTYATYTNKAAMTHRTLAIELMQQKAEKKDVVKIFEDKLRDI